MEHEGLSAAELAEQYAQELSIERERVQYLTTYFGQLVEAMVAGVIIADEDLFVTHCNGAAEKIIGVPRDVMEGMPLSKFLPDEFRGFQESEGSLADIERFQQELMIIRDDEAANIPLLISASPIVLHSGEIEGIVCVAQDLSERRQLEEELLQARKLESVGQLAAGVAHEINTPIQYVRDNTLFFQTEFESLSRLLRGILDADSSCESSQKLLELQKLAQEIDVQYLLEEIPTALKQTLEGAQSVATIVNSMKIFSHPGSDTKQSFDLHAALESTLTVSRNEWKYDAEAITDFCTPDPVIEAYASELNQAFLNIVVNAAHAIREKGTDEKGRITISTNILPEAVEIRISDTGTGLSEEVKDKMFDPFFTTKDVGKGTGQGLTLVRKSIIERHGGTIEIDSTIGKGTSFILRIPSTNRILSD